MLETTEKCFLKIVSVVSKKQVDDLRPKIKNATWLALHPRHELLKRNVVFHAACLQKVAADPERMNPYESESLQRKLERQRETEDKIRVIRILDADARIFDFVVFGFQNMFYQNFCGILMFLVRWMDDSGR